VKEILRFSAETRLPSYITGEQKTIVVEEVMDLLGLSEIRFLPVSQISGGQRKRVNIGMELVADPTIIFFDEPTSGLDASSSKDLCSVLRHLSALGLTLISFFL
jgi:ABC-type multidrug transport system ATPase subunit